MGEGVGDWGTYYVIVKFDHFNYKSLRNNLGVSPDRYSFELRHCETFVNL